MARLFFASLITFGILVGMVIGGIASIPGAIFGAIFVVYVPNLADAITKAAPWAIYGLVLLGCMYAMPRGIAGLVQDVWGRLVGGRGR